MKNTKLRAFNIIKGGYNELLNPYYQGVSGQLAFFLFMSILPILTLFSKILSVFSLSLDSVQSWANINLTESGMNNLQSLFSVSSSQNTAGNIISKAVLVFTTIWSASKAQYSLTCVTDYINSGGEYKRENYIRRRGRSFVMILFILLSLVVALATLVYLPKLFDLIFGSIKAVSYAESLLVKLRWIIVLALYFFTISWVYFLTPSKRIPYRDVIPGSIFSSIGFIVVSFFYSIYINHNRSSNIIYGSLSNIVALLAWFWFMSWVIILGIILNKYWRKTRHE